jgi:2'-hydroxyisoflavone reductase
MAMPPRTRRQFLRWSAAALGLAAARPPWAQAAAAGVAPAPRPLDLLILGGTGFLGPHVVEHALARGHRVTLFNRGRSAAGAFGGRAELLVGDRDPNVGAGIAALEGTRRWDAVIDISGYLPRHVRATASLLRGRARRYAFVSTMGVYDRTRPGTVTEASPMLPLADPGNEDYAGPRYGPQKAEADRVVQSLWGERATSVRPTFILGPGDDTDRYAYWIARIAAGGDVLGPRTDAAPLQWVDVRDLCPWVVELCERDVGGAFNAAAPPVDWDAVLATLQPFAGEALRLRRPSGAVVEALRIPQPLTRRDAPVVRLDGTLATRHGLAYRPLADTSRATWEWWRALPAERRARAEARWPGRDLEREAWLQSARAAPGFIANPS